LRSNFDKINFWGLTKNLVKAIIRLEEQIGKVKIGSSGIRLPTPKLLLSLEGSNRRVCKIAEAIEYNTPDLYSASYPVG
jgi:hypothetical protein